MRPPLIRVLEWHLACAHIHAYMYADGRSISLPFVDSRDKSTNRI